MILNEITPFELNSVSKINDEIVILLNSNHYVSKYLSTYELAPLTKDGLRFNLIDNLDMNDIEVNFNINKVPTGVVDSPPSLNDPKSLRYKDKLIYINDSDEVSVLNLYVGDTLVATIEELDKKDRLIILTTSAFNPQESHLIDNTPHQFNKFYVTNELISTYNTLTNLLELGTEVQLSESKVNKWEGSIYPPFTPIIVGFEYDIQTKDLVPIRRSYDSNYISNKRKNPYLD